MIELKDWGISYSGDDRHVEVLVNEWNMLSCRGVTSPGCVDEKEDLDKLEMLVELESKEATFYRISAARLSCMALDRPDLSFGAKVVASGMASPAAGDVVRLNMVLMYLRVLFKKVKLDYVWHDPVEKTVAWGDSDWAGYRKTRKHASGGVEMLGAHLLHHLSSTQANIGLSSAEAELNSNVKISAECLAVRNMSSETGFDLPVETRTDSSAAKGLQTRMGIWQSPTFGS